MRSAADRAEALSSSGSSLSRLIERFGDSRATEIQTMQIEPKRESKKKVN